MADEKIIDIVDLTVTCGSKTILDQVSFSVFANKHVALVGESGSGKTTCINVLLNLCPKIMSVKVKHLQILGSEIHLGDDEAMRLYRGLKVGFVFQEPLAAFDPLFTIEEHAHETLRQHTDLNWTNRQKRLHEVMAVAGIKETALAKRYVHQLSGGQRQRAMIALAAICQPRILLADEPTSSLDDETQNIVVESLKHVCREWGMTLVFVSHDLSLVKSLAHEVLVLKEGRVLEEGPMEQLMARPKHPYTAQLVQLSQV